jgi:UDP-galactopyranose mutase
MPSRGYTEMFQKMIDNKNIHLLLKTDYKDVIKDINYSHLIYTGQIDSFFNYEFGELPYRSLNFDFKTYDNEYFQEAGQINYPNNYNYTRITEFKHLSRQIHNKTSVAYEYPIAHVNGETIPYYPVPKDENTELFKKYDDEANKLKNTFFIGRLADYKYYNMDETVLVALRLFKQKISQLL